MSASVADPSHSERKYWNLRSKEQQASIFWVTPPLRLCAVTCLLRWHTVDVGAIRCTNGVIRKGEEFGVIEYFRRSRQVSKRKADIDRVEQHR